MYSQPILRVDVMTGGEHVDPPASEGRDVNSRFAIFKSAVNPGKSACSEPVILEAKGSKSEKSCMMRENKRKTLPKPRSRAGANFFPSTHLPVMLTSTKAETENGYAVLVSIALMLQPSHQESTFTHHLGLHPGPDWILPHNQLSCS